MDQLIGPILVLLLLAVLLSAIILPILAIIVTLISRKRISRLEARIDELQTRLSGPRVVETTQTTAAPPEPEVPPPGPTPPVSTTPAATPFSAYQIESMIGRRWVGWVAISLILFATAFFLKYAFENRWIGEVGRVAIGVAFGVG